MKLITAIIFKMLATFTKLLIKIKKPAIVAVTGSVGKTSTKNTIAEVLSSKHRVMWQEKSYNTQTGLPLSVFGLKAPANPRNPISWFFIFLKMIPSLIKYPYDIIVVEMGADHPGEIDYLTKLVPPDIGVVIAAHKVHTELFGTLEAVLKEKSILAYRSNQPVINTNEDNLRQTLLPNLKNAITYGSRADFSINKIVRNKNGTLNFELKYKDHILKINSHFVSKEGILMFAAAAAVADKLGMNHKDIKNSLLNLSPTSGRMNRLIGTKSSTIIDDSYNSSPKAAVAALNNLYEIKEGRKIAILGSMNELGDFEAEAHEIVGEAAAELDLLVTVGEAAKEYVAFKAHRAGLDKNKIHSFMSPITAGGFVSKQVEPGDFILVKGSQNRVFTEEAIKPLLARQEDVVKLVRQEKEWMQRKSEQFEGVK